MAGLSCERGTNTHRSYQRWKDTRLIRVGTVGALVNPVLSGTATGAWNYHRLSWRANV